MARPRIEIDWKLLGLLCALQCTLTEISMELGVSEDTIERAILREAGMSFAEFFRIKRQRGFTSLRRAQFKLAMEGNVAMCIFLGKNMLGQAGKAELTQRTERKPLTADYIEAIKTALGITGKLIPIRSKLPEPAMTQDRPRALPD